MKNVDEDAALECQQTGHVRSPVDGGCLRCLDGIEFTKRPAGCNHQTETIAAVGRVAIEDNAVDMLEVRIHCGDCGAPFKFVGVPSGMSFLSPSSSPGGLELRAPIRVVTPDRSAH